MSHEIGKFWCATKVLLSLYHRGSRRTNKEENPLSKEPRPMSTRMATQFQRPARPSRVRQLSTDTDG